MDKSNKILAGWMVISLVAIGLLGIFAALLSLFNEYNYIGVGLCLLAASYAFSSVLKAYR